jgi:hypothetical protein
MPISVVTIHRLFGLQRRVPKVCRRWVWRIVVLFSDSELPNFERSGNALRH